MPDYKAMYLALFNSVTDAINAMLETSEALAQAQRNAEDMYIDEEEDAEDN
ncbi:MAG: hypothetical protein LBN00_12400 [Oscillospiraceae bacterium]|jgi:hypothetical protein|nr:hypothetical protein [Oscillospiraceae bacterium]